MKTRIGFYPKLALDGIRKNKRIYVPYIITGAVMVMMYYILTFLADSPLLMQMAGGGTLRMVLPLGSGIIAMFSLVFLFYTNSFLVRQRNPEFGLYNVLGMDKRNISVIMFWENIMVTIVSLLSGLFLGVVLAKLAELGLLNILNTGIDFQLRIGFGAIKKTGVLFVGIYLLLLCNALIRVFLSKPLELLHSSKVGEKVPKANWFMAIIGVCLLGMAYYIAVSIEEPLSAIIWFFTAVLMVIVATYLLFIAGSVAFCKILQKSKRYYYKANHFVSVSSMVYRMKRNGAGLASICILSTMVLVMVSSTTSLYVGAEDSLHARYPQDVQLRVDMLELEPFGEDNLEVLRTAIEEVVTEQSKVVEYRTAEIAGLLGESVIVDVGLLNNFNVQTYDNIGVIQVVPLADYNRIMGTDKVLDKGECFIYCTRMEYIHDTICIADGQVLQVKAVLDDFFAEGVQAMMMVPTISIVTDEFDTVVEPLLPLIDQYGNQMMQLHWNYGFDMDTEGSQKLEAKELVRGKIAEFSLGGENGIYAYSVECREAESADFYVTYGSLFFLGIMLSIVFLFAAVLIIYYKQISEGYEDQKRFEIMQKVGMTKKEIRRSINSQILTVFFLPLVFAGLHLAFAFPMVWKLLQLFNLYNLPLLIGVTVVCFLVFGVCYALVYKWTAGAYYKIVSGAKES